MLATPDPGSGSGAYVALELVTGSLDGRTGSFALQHNGTMSNGEATLHVTVVPGSGTGELVGLTGRMQIIITGKRHDYEFEYSLSSRAP
jgi:hypothetical protein